MALVIVQLLVLEETGEQGRVGGVLRVGRW